mgnify:CR=1 FL=1
MRRMELKQFEVDYIIKIRSWADSQTSAMREESRNVADEEEAEERDITAGA